MKATERARETPPSGLVPGGRGGEPTGTGSGGGFNAWVVVVIVVGGAAAIVAYDAIEQSLVAWGKSLSGLDAKESLWPTDDAERAAKGLGVTSGTFYGNLQRYLRAAGLPAAGVHILRHSAAKLRRDAGESIEDVSRFLDHSSLQVTTVYLRRLEGQEDRSWRQVAEAIGV